MALTATIYLFEIQLADVDRNVYERLEFRVPCQPSETAEYLLSRVLAYCLEYAEGIVFSRGIVEPEMPSVAVRDLTGALKLWIEVGAPDADRLHKASKASPRVAVYTHRDPARVLALLADQKIHNREKIEFYSFDGELISELAARLDRRNTWDLSITDRHVYVSVNGDTVEGDVVRHAIP